MWKRVWKMRLLRLALVCAVAFGLSFSEPVSRGVDNLWRRAGERNFRIPSGSRWWTFRAADRTDRVPGWTCAEDDRNFYLRVDTGIRRLPREGLSPLADPCDPGEDPDTLVPDDALVVGSARSDSAEAKSFNDSAVP
jgi:hypothetical protein